MDDSAHPSIESLEVYLTKKLSEQERDSIRKHVIGCDECQRTLTRYLATKLGYVRLDRNEVIWLG